MTQIICGLCRSRNFAKVCFVLFFALLSTSLNWHIYTFKLIRCPFLTETLSRIKTTQPFLQHIKMCIWFFSLPDLSFFLFFVFLPEGFATASQEQQVSVLLLHSSLCSLGRDLEPLWTKTLREAAEPDLHIVFWEIWGCLDGACGVHEEVGWTDSMSLSESD